MKTKALNWNNYKGSRYLFAEHKESGRTVIAHFDSACVYWDFYYTINGEYYKCMTNANHEVAKEKYYVEEGSDSDNVNMNLKIYINALEELKEIKTVFHPEFETILRKQ